MKKQLSLSLIALSGVASAQIPDLLNTLDAGSRSMGAGGAFGVTSADTFSILNNPAGIGFMGSKSFGIAYRNMPKSLTSLSGNIANPVQSTDALRGGNQISHIGFAAPFKSGVLGISYQIGGYIDDFRSGTNVTIGGFNNATYQEQMRAKTDFYTISFGKTNGEGNRSTGFGLAIANLNLFNRQEGFVPGNPPTTLISSNNSSSTWGVGLVAGMQYVPMSRPNVTVGASIRTPIKLSGNNFASSLYSTIPGQVSIGMATRTDNFRGKEDFLITGIQASYTFGGSGSGFFDRTNQFLVGFGGEWNIVRDDFIIPIRAGYTITQGGGGNFGDRNALTFGFGFRPAGSGWNLDLNYAFPRGGSSDFALALSYRFDK